MNKEIFKKENISHRNNNENWFLTVANIEKAKNFYEQEKINPLAKDKMFFGGIYTILSIGEKSEKQKNLLKILQEEGLNTPGKIITYREKLNGILDKKGNRPRFSKKIPNFIFEFAEWWQNSTLPEEIIRDSKKERGIEFRDRLAGRYSPDKTPGMGPKVASYFMEICGYEDVVTIDSRLWQFLKENKYCPEKIPDKEHSGTWLQRYKEFEEIISNIAREHNLTPVIFRLALWHKYGQKTKKDINSL